MTTTRYTYKNMEAEIAYLNDQMKAYDIQWVLVPGARYGYTAIDLATPEQAEQYCIHSTLRTGTPRECIAEAHRFFAHSLARKQAE